MWYSLLLNAIFSILIIFIMHQLWEYCKLNYTTSKTKNVFDIKESKYRQMVEDMESRVLTGSNEGALSVSKPPSLGKPQPYPDKFLQSDEKEWINTELSAFINTL